MSLTSGFLVVKRFEVLYRGFAADPKFDTAVYALPVFGRSPKETGVRYRGIDRDAITPFEKGTLAEMRALELNGERIDGTEEFLPTCEQAVDVLGWANEESPEDYEIICAKVADGPDPPARTFERLGFEPTYFAGDHFSAICDCMCFPRWHGTDREGTLFRPYFDRLNSHGLFDDACLAAEFLTFYLSIDCTERGEYEIAEVWAPEAPAFSVRPR